MTNFQMEKSLRANTSEVLQKGWKVINKIDVFGDKKGHLPGLSEVVEATNSPSTYYDFISCFFFQNGQLILYLRIYTIPNRAYYTTHDDSYQIHLTFPP